MKNEITAIEQYFTVIVLYRVVVTLTLDEILNSETTTAKSVVSRRFKLLTHADEILMSDHLTK